MDNTAILSRARQVLMSRSRLRRAQAALGEGFVATVNLILETLGNGGKIVVTGVGKTAHRGETLRHAGQYRIDQRVMEPDPGDARRPWHDR